MELKIKFFLEGLGWELSVVGWWCGIGGVELVVGIGGWDWAGYKFKGIGCFVDEKMVGG